MRRSTLIGVFALGTCVACSSADDHTPSASDGGSGNGGTAAGGSANGGSGGGSSGTGGGSSGTGGSGGGGASAGGTTSSGGAEISTGGLPPACAPDAGVDSGRTWRDFEEATCKPCPSTPLTECAQFMAAPGASFDAATQVLTLHVTPGLNEILGLRLEGRSGVQDSAEYAFVDVDGKVSENVLTFDFSGKLPDGSTGFYEGLLVGDDACGQGIDTSTSQKLQFRLDAAGAVDGPACVD
jgi:hypothetical protein